MAHQFDLLPDTTAIADDPDIVRNEDDQVALEAADGVPIDDTHTDESVDMASPSSTGTSYASDIQSHFIHIFQLQHPVVQRRIRTDTWAQPPQIRVPHRTLLLGVSDRTLDLSHQRVG